MLNVLVHSDIGDVAVVVTRYFGGIKLGTGGLVRAYAGTVQAALESMPRAERVDFSEVRVVVDYEHVSALKQLVAGGEILVLDESYAESATFHLRMPTPDLVDFQQALADATRGKARLTG
jgi:putative IMPACT (imprinted ancient) family translation regulator